MNKYRMKRRIGPVAVRLIIILTVALMLPMITAAPGGAADTTKLKTDKDELDQQMKRVKKLLDKKTLEKNSIADQFYKVDRELSNTRNKLNKKTSELKTIEKKKAYLEKQLDIANDKFQAYRKQYKDRLVAYYKNGHAGYLEVLFNSSSFSDFISRVTYLKILTKNDLEIMSRLKTMREEIDTMRVEVEDNRIEAELARNSLQQERQQIEQIAKEKKDRLNVISKDVDLLQKQWDELEEESQRIERELRAASGKGPQYKFAGTFGSPVCGRTFYVTSPFGPRKAPKRGASTYHRGIDLRAGYNEDICAAADGTVIQAGYRRGYGNTVIVKHGSDYSTVYGHGLRVLVSEGQKVKKGQVIMKADSTGISTGNHLHFEIRLNNVAVDPLGYLR